jgi:hypothetical protein
MNNSAAQTVEERLVQIPAGAVTLEGQFNSARGSPGDRPLRPRKR